MQSIVMGGTIMVEVEGQCERKCKISHVDLLYSAVVAVHVLTGELSTMPIIFS